MARTAGDSEYNNFERYSMKTYIFFRENGFYPVELRDDADAVANAIHNTGTIKVETVSGEFIWPKPEHKQ